MSIEVNKIGKDTEIILDLRFDSIASPFVNAAIAKELNSVEDSLIINMEKVDYISSVGLRVLIWANKQLDGKKLIIKNANSSVKEVMKLTGLSDLFIFR